MAAYKDHHSCSVGVARSAVYHPIAVAIAEGVGHAILGRLGRAVGLSSEFARGGARRGDAGATGGGGGVRVEMDVDVGAVGAPGAE